MSRRYLLTDLDPKWVRWDGREVTIDQPADSLQFDCPEAHGVESRCFHTIAVTPALDGVARPSPQSNKVIWQRTGEAFDRLTLLPSIRCSGYCHFHGYIRNGKIEFCGDSH